MKKAKILYIITQSSWGGAQRYVFDLATHLDGKFDVTVAFGGAGMLKDRLDRKNVRCITLKNLVREISPLKDFLGFWEIYQLIKKERPDIVHTNSSKAEILGNLAAALARVPKIIHTAHGFVFNEPMGFLKKSFYVFLERLANKPTDTIICVSDYDRSTALIHQIAPATRLTVIRNGIDMDEHEFSGAAQNEEPIPSNGKFIITTIANFYLTKGLPYLIEAAAILSQDSSDLEFWIIGDGRERPAIEKLIAHHRLKNIKLWGFQNSAENFLHQSDIFVLPSVKEGFPYAILEAMAEELPIVATKVGGVAEAITDGENGLLVPPADSQALAEKISILRKDLGMRKLMSRNNRGKILQYFSLENMLEKTGKVYAE